jgi:hypothetical protein
LPGNTGYLKEDVTLASLEQLSRTKSDMRAAAEMQEAKRKLFAGFQQKRTA